MDAEVVLSSLPSSAMEETQAIEDDRLRLLFICCHPDLPATQQIALALRVISGLSVKQIARAFLVSEAAMEQRITRAKARVAGGDAPFETPGPIERAERHADFAAALEPADRLFPGRVLREQPHVGLRPRQPAWEPDHPTARVEVEVDPAGFDGHAGDLHRRA